MANGISSIASSRTLTAVKNSAPVARPADLARTVPESGGEVLPAEGKNKPTRAVDVAEISQAVTRINKIIQNIQRDLSFNLDEDSGRTVIRVVDSESGELIRQIPSDEVLAIVTHLRGVQEDLASREQLGQGLIFSDIT